MMLPEVFEPFLDSLAFPSSRSAGLDPLLSISSAIGEKSADGSVGKHVPTEIFQLFPTNPSLPAFVRKAEEVLSKVGHPVSRPLIDALLATAVFCGSNGKSRLEFLNHSLRSFRTLTAHLYIITDVRQEFPPHKIFGFTLSTLRWSVFDSRCRRTTSDYARRYQKNLQGRVALESPEFELPVINLLEVMKSRGLTANDQWHSLMLLYFEALADMHFEMMWSYLDRQQALDVALGNGGIDPAVFREKLVAGSEQVAIYLDKDSRRPGYVVPKQRGIVVAVSKLAESSISLPPPGSSVLGDAITECAMLLQQAVRFQRAARFQDAALYATIALERVFTQKTSTTDAIARRVALICHRALGKELVKCRREVVELYEARSRFVHDGQQVSEAVTRDILCYARLVLLSMLRLHGDPENQASSFFEDWKTKIDAFYGNFEAGLPSDHELLARWGVLPAPDVHADG